MNKIGCPEKAFRTVAADMQIDQGEKSGKHTGGGWWFETCTDLSAGVLHNTEALGGHCNQPC